MSCSGLSLYNTPKLKSRDPFGARARHCRASGRDPGAGSRGSIDWQINETPIINDSEKGRTGSGSTDYGRETEVLSSRD